MKKLIYLSLMFAQVLFLQFNSTAQNTKIVKSDSLSASKKSAPSCSKNCQFVDKNNDGICDKCKNYKPNCHCVNFIDKNKDSVCDNYSNCRKPARNSSANNGCKNNHNCCRKK